MSKLLSVSLPDELSRSTDDLAAAQGRTRSEVVRDALRSYLWRERWREATREPGAMAERLQRIDRTTQATADTAHRLTDRIAPPAGEGMRGTWLMSTGVEQTIS